MNSNLLRIMIKYGYDDLFDVVSRHGMVNRKEWGCICEEERSSIISMIIDKGLLVKEVRSCSKVKIVFSSSQSIAISNDQEQVYISTPLLYEEIQKRKDELKWTTE